MITQLKHILTSRYFLWALLALPAFAMSLTTFADDPRALRGLLHPTGEFAARLMIVALMATPLTQLPQGWRGPRWLLRNRRYFGVAAFGYAALHALAYVLAEGSLVAVTAEINRFYILTGWLAFLIFVPLVATSSNYAVRKLGPLWKKLQRWVYLAAILTLAHWASLDNWQALPGALAQFSPLILAYAYCLWRPYHTTRAA